MVLREGGIAHREGGMEGLRETLRRGLVTFAAWQECVEG